uniref:cDNA clone:002-118-H07, full insert sequence n=2 Tax=Oryza sativa subsp. japonica TaxID=39947 RepID=Q6L4D6_ORYSJ|nr:unknown protein [Oryza sativa Japonica Group]BAG97874.1 unnamed protein product [Oryza sativa Japonica Group]
MPSSMQPAAASPSSSRRAPSSPAVRPPTSSSRPAGTLEPFPYHYQRRLALTPPPQVVAPAAPAPPPQVHTMVTRSKTGSLKPVDRLVLSVSHNAISPLSANYRSALADPNWRAAMAEEFKALIDNGTWRLVPRPPGANVVTGKWIFKHKFHSDGSLARHKARWVVRGYSQQHDIDYNETFSPVVKPSTIRVVLSITTSRSWPINQLDVKNAFLHGTLDETVYCQ